MLRSAVGALALVLLLDGDLAAAQPAPGQQPPPQAGVLCTWGIELTVKEIGSRCFPGRDAGFKQALDDSIAAIDRFILRYGDAAQPALDRQKAQIVSQAGDVCSNKDAVQMYQLMSQMPPGELQKQTAALLATPRKPTFNPCL
jgi:hypothetical protein